MRVPGSKLSASSIPDYGTGGEARKRAAVRLAVLSRWQGLISGRAAAACWFAMGVLTWIAMVCHGMRACTPGCIPGITRAGAGAGGESASRRLGSTC